MKLAGAGFEKFVARADPRVRAAVVFGRDEGLIAERAAALARAVCPDLKDAFRVVEIEGSTLKGDGARLADEMAQMSMMGGRRVVRVRSAGEDAAGPLEAALDGPGDALIVVESTSATTRGALVKLAETRPDAVAVACYEDDEGALETVVAQTLARFGLRADSEAMAFLVDNLGGDRALSRSELEKLALYKGPAREGAAAPDPVVTVEDAAAVVGDSAAIGLDDAVYACFDGDQDRLDRALERTFAEGITPVRMLTAMQSHVSRVLFVKALLARNESFDFILKKLRPQLHFSRKPGLLRHTRAWSDDGLANALDALLSAEMQIKSAGSKPDEAIVRRVALGLAARARRR